MSATARLTGTMFSPRNSGKGLFRVCACALGVFVVGFPCFTMTDVLRAPPRGRLLSSGRPRRGTWHDKQTLSIYRGGLLSNNSIPYKNRRTEEGGPCVTSAWKTARFTTAWVCTWRAALPYRFQLIPPANKWFLV